MISRKSSGSMPVESAVEPTRSTNITVTWRRSAWSRGLDSDPGASWGVVEASPASSAIARSNLRRSPRRTTPIPWRSSSVRSRRISKSIRCSAKRSAYSDNPSEASQSLTEGIVLGIPSHEVVYASAQPFEIGTCWHASECRGVELARRSFCECVSRLLRPLDAAAARDDFVKPQHFAREAALARPGQEAGNPRPVCVMGAVERARQQQGPFALPEVTVDLLAVSRNVPLQVQNVVGDLEGEPEQVAEPIESAEIPILAIGDEGANSHRVNEAVPTSLLEHKSQVVVRSNGEIVVSYPAELHGLPFQGLDDHVIDFIEDAHRRYWSESLAGPAEKPHGKRVHGIAGVQGNWDPRVAMHCRDPAPQITAVFDIVVHEKCIVQHFQAGGGGKRILHAAAQRPRGRDAQGRAKTLA